ncbi:hypothetical protein A2U01_0092778, partial [Trifolium medium]|nr:hypothetical protein [Trifolium medium]
MNSTVMIAIHQMALVHSRGKRRDAIDPMVRMLP